MSVNVRQTTNHRWKRRSLGTTIAQRRMELGLTQAALAERVAMCGDWGFRQSDISRLERGIVTLPHFTRMRSLAAALELPVGELLAQSGWAGAEEAFTTADRQPAGQDHAAPETTGNQPEGQPSCPGASNEELRQLREEIIRLRETVEMMQEALTGGAVARRADDTRSA